MRLEIFVLGLTAFFVYNAYADGKYTKMVMSFKKYYKMIFYVLLGVGIYLMLKRNPSKGRDMLLYANNVVKFMPIDRSSMDMLSPIIDFTSKNDTDEEGFMESLNGISPPGFCGERRITSSGKNGTKRSVSETKKKYVASNQNWKCGNCQSQLDHTFEIDHKLRLEYGGGNDVQNLIALCRNCHGRKTADENM
ncbi:MAG: HNH endonuclease [Candidatus Marinimicrobia bacterium]|nr:HNH endonuclease [Candidatus Neomarinimicrobiota bacterium]